MPVRIINGLFLLICLSIFSISCERWEVSDKPINGLKISKPVGDTIIAGNDIVLAGPVLDDDGLASANYSLKYNPFPWEGSMAATDSTPVDISSSISLSGISSNIDDTINSSPNWPQGNVTFKSVVNSVTGQISDSIIINRFIKNSLYPIVSLTQPRVGPDFNKFSAGDSVLVRGVVRHSNPMRKLFVHAIISQILPNGRLNGISTVLLDSGFVFREINSRVAMPIEAVSGSLYRLVISATTDDGYQYYKAPGMQTR